jgi:hypothetical protein
VKKGRRKVKRGGEERGEGRGEEVKRGGEVN